MDVRGERGFVATGIVVIVAVVVLVSAVAFVMLTKRGGEEAAAANDAALDAAAIADDRQAQSSLRNALAAAKTLWIDSESYGAVSPATIGQVETALDFTDGPSTGSAVVSVAATDEMVGFAVLSATGTCWYIRDAGTTTYGSGSQCTGQTALTAATATTF